MKNYHSKAYITIGSAKMINECTDSNKECLLGNMSFPFKGAEDTAIYEDKIAPNETNETLMNRPNYTPTAI